MRTLTRAVLPGIALGLGAGFLSPQTALAAPECEYYDPILVECEIGVEIPGTSGGPGDPVPAPGEGGSSGGGGGPVAAQCIDDLLHVPPAAVECTSDYGYWSNALDAYIQLVEPQPPVGSPVWAGHTDGAIYRFSYAMDGTFPGTGGGEFWSATPPAGPAAPPDPAVLAQQAIDAMQLRAIEIGIVPETTPGSMGLIGLPTWMWVDQPTENTYGPISRTVAAGGVSVTATAEVGSIVWSMGDGHSVTCTTTGTPYADSYGRQSSPDCGYTYTRTSAGQPGGAYTVAATSSWTVTWAGGGQTGTIDDISFTQEAQVRIGELQVIQTK